MSSLIRKNILNAIPYVAGKPIEETKRELKLKRVIKLASNENPLGVSPMAKKAVSRSFSMVNRYPDSQGFYLKKKLAKYYNVAPASVVLGNGSDELIDIIIKAFVEDDENIVTADITFLEYEIIAKVLNRKVLKVPLKYFKYDLDGIRKRIDNKTKLVFIANPNNPTGTYVTKEEMRSFIQRVPEDVIVVVDEAYDTFIDVNDFPSSQRMISNNNLIVLKTFSKAYGLAGLRIGYALTNLKLAQAMERTRQPFNVNLLAQEAAIAALDDRKFLNKTRRVILEGKAYLYDKLKKIGVPYVPSVANFILIDVGRPGVSFFKDMLKRGVIVRDMQQYGLNNFVRVTVGTKKENEIFIKTLKKTLGGHA